MALQLPISSRLGRARAPTRQVQADTVIFLDVDGVLHSLYGDDLFRETCCSLLERIVRSTGAAIVLSSTWRTEPGKVAVINSVLMQKRLAPVADSTEDLSGPREAEICEWLDRHPAVRRWIAIDDMDLGAPGTSAHTLRMRGHFVRTNSDTGLTPQDADLAIRLLLAQSHPGCPSPSQRLCAQTRASGAASIAPSPPPGAAASGWVALAQSRTCACGFLAPSDLAQAEQPLRRLPAIARASCRAAATTSVCRPPRHCPSVAAFSAAAHLLPGCLASSAPRLCAPPRWLRSQ